jgi:aminoglycoside phosphotransferase (APT) family kinase protein
MRSSDASNAVEAAVSTAVALDLKVDDADVLHDSNRITLRLRPCDVLARVAPQESRPGAELEVEVVRRLTRTGSPVASLEPRAEPRVYLHDGFAVTLWTYYEPASPLEVEAAAYAQALKRLHAGMRQVELDVPHFTDRVAEAQSLVGSRARTPDLQDVDRELLRTTLRESTEAILLRASPEQLLHGEPHPGNLLGTKQGQLFTDFETCCRGPVEFDVAHAPEEVSAHYREADQVLLRECRTLILAMIASWRWDRDDQLPNGREMGSALLAQLRGARALRGPGAAAR